MATQSILSLLDEANSKLTFAESELLRPGEDTIAFAVCHASKEAISRLLAGMLAYNYANNLDKESAEKKIEQLNKLGMSALLEECIKLDNNFSSLDISALDCSSLHKEDRQNVYCLSPAKVHDCTVIGRQVERLVNNYIGSKNFAKA